MTTNGNGGGGPELLFALLAGSATRAGLPAALWLGTPGDERPVRWSRLRRLVAAWSGRAVHDRGRAARRRPAVSSRCLSASGSGPTATR